MNKCAGNHVEKREHFHTADENVNKYSHFEKQYENCSKHDQYNYHCDIAILLWNIQPK